jgi:hypothetical protein
MRFETGCARPANGLGTDGDKRKSASRGGMTAGKRRVGSSGDGSQRPSHATELVAVPAPSVDTGGLGQAARIAEVAVRRLRFTSETPDPQFPGSRIDLQTGKERGFCA